MKRNPRTRLLVLAVLGLFAVASALCFYHFTFRRPIGSGPAGPPVDRARFESVWSDDPVFLVGLGDSVTAGLGARPGYSYFDRLLKNPDDEFEDMRGIRLPRVLPSLRFTNLAVSGTTSTEHLRRQIPRLPASPSNEWVIVVMTTGGNDLIHNYGRVPPRPDGMYGAAHEQAKPWIAAFEERLHGMIDAINAAYPGRCHIFLANIYDPTDGVGDIEKSGLPPWPDGLRILADYNRIIERCAEGNPNVHRVDLQSAFLGHGLHCTQFWRDHYHARDPHYWYFINLEDPNERGYDAIRRLFLNAMANGIGSHLNN